MTERSDSQPQPGVSAPRDAADAAHRLREALATAGLLARVPECRGYVDDSGRPMVELGAVDATTAALLAARIKPARRRPRRENGCQE